MKITTREYIEHLIEGVNDFIHIEYDEYWDEYKLKGKGHISMKHTAIACGTGALGKNTLLLNPKYGNELTIGAILTDLDLKSDDLCENICIKECHKCIENCPVGAIQDGKVVQKLCRNNAYGKTKRGFDTVECNKCRRVCPMRYGKTYKQEGIL